MINFLISSLLIISMFFDIKNISFGLALILFVIEFIKYMQERETKQVLKQYEDEEDDE